MPNARNFANLCRQERWSPAVASERAYVAGTSEIVTRISGQILDDALRWLTDVSTDVAAIVSRLDVTTFAELCTGLGKLQRDLRDLRDRNSVLSPAILVEGA